MQRNPRLRAPSTEPCRTTSSGEKPVPSRCPTGCRRAELKYVTEGLFRAVFQESVIQDVIDDVGVNLHSRKRCASKRRRPQVSYSRGSSTNEHNFVTEGFRSELVRQDIGHRIMREGARRALIIDHDLAAAVRMYANVGAELNLRDPDRAVRQNGLFRLNSQKCARRHHIERSVSVPLVEILRAPVRQNKSRPANNPIGIRRSIEETDPGNIASQGGSQRSDVGLSSFREHSGSCKLLDQMDAILLLESLPSADDLRKCEKTKLVCVLIQGGAVDAPYIRVRVQEKIAQDDRSEPPDSFSELFVGVRRHRELLHLRGDPGIYWHARFFSLLQLGPKHAQRSRVAIQFRLAESDIKPGDFGAIVVKGIQHFCEIGAGKRPAAEHLLGVLIDIHDDDARIGPRGSPRPVTKARVESIQLQPLHKFEQGGPFLLKKDKVIERQRRDGDDEAEEKRDAMAPPRLKQLVEAE